MYDIDVFVVQAICKCQFQFTVFGIFGTTYSMFYIRTNWLSN